MIPATLHPAQEFGLRRRLTISRTASRSASGTERSKAMGTGRREGEVELKHNSDINEHI